MATKINPSPALITRADTKMSECIKMMNDHHIGSILVVSDQGQEKWICELIREAALRDARQELPHSITVTIDEMSQRDAAEDQSFFDIHATIHIERDSQRGILLGHQGERLKDIGTRARADIERILGARVFLGLHIKVSKEWQRDPKLLERLGFGEN
jgi:GTP-binding protein Era